MNDLEEMLSEAMHDCSDRLTLPPATVHAAVRAVRRTRRTRLALSGGAAVVVAGGAAAAIVATHNSPEGAPGLRVVGPATSGAPSSPPESAPPSPTMRIVRHGAPEGSTPSEALQHVSLPDPAPGFPLRRHPDQIGYTDVGAGPAYWTASFLVGQSPPRGGVPTGPEASVIVIDAPVPANPDSHNQIFGDPVIGHRSVDGHAAYLTTAGGQTNLVFDTGRFNVEVSGDEGATINELVTLAGALSGLESH